MSLITDRWNKDIEVLGALRTGWNDRLSIVDGHLHLEKGGEDIKWGVTIIPVTKDPSAVADHLESFIKCTAKEHFSALQTSKSDTPAYYEQVAQLHRQSKCLSKRMSDLQYAFRSYLFNSTYERRYSHLFDLAHGFSEQVKTFKSTLTKPPLSERAARHIEYNERTEPVQYFYPKRVPLGETVAAAKKALSLAGPNQPRSLLTRICIVIGVVVLAFPSMVLSGLKIIFWNPFERLIHGTVTTRSPFCLTVNLCEEGLFGVNNHWRAYQNYCSQLLHCPVITDEVASAFEQLAPRAEVLDLQWAEVSSFSLDELKPFIEEDIRPGAISVDTFIEQLKNTIYMWPNLELSLRWLNAFYSNYNRLYLEKRSEDDLNKFLTRALSTIDTAYQPHKTWPWMSPKVLQKLLDSAAASPTCHKIVLNDSVARLPHVKNFLSKHSYQLMKREAHHKDLSTSVYRRR